jgi:hypothetical protein
MRLALLTAVLLAFGPATTPAAAPGDPVRATRRTGEIVLDGRLEEPAWDAAPAHDGFFQTFPLEGQPPSERTEVRVLYDDRALYVGVVCHDGLPAEIARPLGRRDNAPYGDAVVVLIDSTRDRRTAYWFEVNAAGVQRDALLFGEDESNGDWDAVWDGAAATLKDGWSAELRIPLSVLRFSAAPEQVWGFAVKRVLARTREELRSAPLKRGERGVVARLADLTGLTGLEPVQELSLTPYLAARASWRPRTDQDARPRLFDPSGDLGIDLRASLGRGLALQATVNPDFGQVEADQIMQNLSTFELFFPEKRPFFTQGMDLFQGLSPNDHRSPQQLFYSRRIGLDAPILGAAKLAGRVSDTLEVGLLEAVVMGAAAPADFDGTRTRRRYRFDPAQPLHFGLADSLPLAPPAARNFLVGSARWQPAATATLRAAAASVLPLERACTAQDFGLPDVPGRCDALTGQAATLDASLRSPSGDWYARGQLSGSVFGGGGFDAPPDPPPPGYTGALVRTLPDGTALRRGDPGWGAAAYAGRQGAEPWRFDLSWEYESPRLELNAAGFQRTQNEQLARGVLRYVRPSGGGPFHMYGLHLGTQGRWTTDGTGRLLGSGAWLSAEFQLRSFHYFGVNLNVDPAGDDVREIEGTGTAFRYVSSAGGEVWISSDRGRPVWVEAYLNGGRTEAKGALRSVGWWATGGIVSVRPHPRLETRLDASYERSRWPARWVKDGTPGALPGEQHTHFFAELSAPAVSVTLRQSLVLTPRLTLQAYAQLFSATGRYGPYYQGTAPDGGRIGPGDLRPPEPPADVGFPDFRESALNLSAVLRWEYRLGSTLFLVYTRNAVEPDWPGTADLPLTLRPRRLAQGPTTDTVLLKWTWFWAG